MKNLFYPCQCRKMRSVTCRDTMSEILLVGLLLFCRHKVTGSLPGSQHD
jgi:hypothetical protein